MCDCLLLPECRCNYRLLASLSRISRVRRARRDFSGLFGFANSLRAKAIMRLFDSKWIVGKRFSSFPADVAPGDSPKTFWARVCRYIHVSERIIPTTDAHLRNCSFCYPTALCYLKMIGSITPIGSNTYSFVSVFLTHQRH